MLKKRLFATLLIVPLGSSAAWGSLVDSVVFADSDSASAHALKGTSTQTIEGGLGIAALQLMPPPSESWRGGRVDFRMDVDPERPNYFTAKFWGGDVAAESEQRTMLFIDGKQVGQRHLGEVDQLDIMNTHPRFYGRFFYKTLPLPTHLTRGKESVEMSIEVQGGIWAYGNTFEKFQKKMEHPSRGFYRAYTHTDPFFVPGADEVQGEPVADYPTSQGPGPEARDGLRKKVNDGLDKLLAGGDELKTEDIHFLGIGYLTPWSTAYQKPETLEKISRGIDQHFHEYAEEPDDDLGHWWVGYGPDAEVVHMLADELAPMFDTPLEGSGLTRREGWGEMFLASRDWHVARRRSYTNQSMIVDMNIYRCNSGLRVLDAQRAWPETKALRLLYESAGLERWSGNWVEGQPHEWPKGKNLLLLTDRALTKELGYVGFYGDSVLDLVLHMYNATRPTPGAEGNARLKKQLVKIAEARSYFRYPLPDDDGYRSMQIQTVIGWRDWKYPGGIVYDQMSGRDGGALDVAAATLDPQLMGFGWQMIEDNHVFSTYKKRAQGRSSNILMALTVSLNAYDTFMEHDPTPHRLPMTPGQPDFVFADPEIGVVALKNGDDILYASLYWRARYAINDVARVHHLTATLERDAGVRIETRFKDSDIVYTMPDLSNAPFSADNEKHYKAQGMLLAAAGTEQPIAQVPADQKGWKPGEENFFAGRGDFYLMEYGPYLVAMNCTPTTPQDFDVPAAFVGARDLVTQEATDAAATTLRVAPGQTVVLYRSGAE